MNRFQFRAIDSRGAAHQGELQAQDPSAAHEELARRGLTPFKLRRVDEKPAAKSADPSRERRTLSNVELAEVLGNLATLLEAAVPLQQALEVLASASQHPAVSAMVRRASERLKAGRDLATILEGASDRAAFLEGLIKVGQLSGDLGRALRHAASILRRDIEIRRSLAAAFSYPAFVFVSLLCGLGVILGVVAPALEPLLVDVDPSQAWFLHAIVGFSFTFRSAWPFLTLVTLGAAMATFALMTGRLTQTLDALLAHGPIGRTIGELEFGAWAIGAGRLIAGGAPVPTSVLGAAAFARNVVIRNHVVAIARVIRDGVPLSEALRRTTAAPADLARMALVGERAGALGPMLERAGEQVQARALRRINRASAILAPLALLLMGGSIGLVIAGLLTGVSSIGDAALQ